MTIKESYYGKSHGMYIAVRFKAQVYSYMKCLSIRGMRDSLVYVVITNIDIYSENILV
jgi:hypothetical protein